MKEPEQLERELDTIEFESLLKKAKYSVEEGHKCYLKGLFDDAINNLHDAHNFYQLAIEKSPSSHEKKSIEENLIILNEDLSKACIENGKKHNLIAQA